MYICLGRFEAGPFLQTLQLGCLSVQSVTVHTCVRLFSSAALSVDQPKTRPGRGSALVVLDGGLMVV